MTPEKLAELEKLEAASMGGDYEDADFKIALRNNARDLFAALREAWAALEWQSAATKALSESQERLAQEVKDVRASLDIAYSKGRADERDFSRVVEERLTKERDEARAALRLLWEEATDSECCFRTVNSGLDQHHISEPCRAAVKAALGEK
jgi:hypothetical protein